VALLVLSVGTAPLATTWLHAAGVGWLAACAAALVQALLGLAPLELSGLTADRGRTDHLGYRRQLLVPDLVGAVRSQPRTASTP
jgi:hypothetical protein